jgi:hypothetical protein
VRMGGGCNWYRIVFNRGLWFSGVEPLGCVTRDLVVAVNVWRNL